MLVKVTVRHVSADFLAQQHMCLERVLRRLQHFKLPLAYWNPMQHVVWQVRIIMSTTLFCHTALQELRLAGHLFTGSVPLSYTTLSSLRVLDISRNKLSGTLPDTISGLAGMQLLNVSSNNFEGPLPQLLFGLQELQSADFSRNRFVGECCQAIANPTISLKNISIHDHVVQIIFNSYVWFVSRHIFEQH
jgi:hypothetical protein